MARRVAGAMIDVEREVADRHLVAVLQPAVGFEAFAVDAISRAVLAQPVDPEAVGFMGSFARHAQVAGASARLAAMVAMAGGNEDLLFGDATPHGRGAFL